MLLPRPFIRYAATELTRRLAKGVCEIRRVDAVAEEVHRVILDEIAQEEAINAEARELLNQYTEYMRTNRIPYSEMFNRIKRKIVEERKIIPAASRDGKTKMSREKINELSHKIAQRLPRIPDVRVLKGWNDARLEIARELTAILTLEQQADERARRMIANQKRHIPEGGEEWNVLHRNYYEKEMARLGIDLREPEARPG